jgi:hypothetical protein
MAIIVTCPVCGRANINKAYCDGCRVAFCEDILTRIKECLLKGIPIPPELAETIKSNNWTTVQEHLNSRRKDENLQEERVIWETYRDEAMERFQREWEVEHPDPNPPTF